MEDNLESPFMRRKRRVVGLLLLLTPVAFWLLVAYADFTRPFKMSEAPDWIEPSWFWEQVWMSVAGVVLLSLPTAVPGLLLLVRRVGRPVVFFASLAVFAFGVLSFLISVSSEMMSPSSFLYLALGRAYFGLGPTLSAALSLCLFRLDRPYGVLLGFWLPFGVLAVSGMLISLTG